MNSNASLENIRPQCRICLGNGDINVFNSQFSLKRELENDCNATDNTRDVSFTEIMDMFSNSQDYLNFSEEFPLLCLQCSTDLKFCYTTYEKIKLGSNQLENLYLQSLNQYTEEEHLVDIIEENELNDVKDTNLIEIAEEINLPEYEHNNAKEPATSKQMTICKNDSFIITQFIPENLEPPERFITNEIRNDGQFRPQHFFTMNLKAVEVKDFENHDMDSTQLLSDDINEPAVYLCQYCPQAFAKSDYLKTHVQKSHVCKFCTQPFRLTEDLFSHIRERHTKHKCAICHKLLSSGTNLRHHIKRVHRIKLPAKVTLIDFIKSTSLENNHQDNEIDILPEVEAADIEFNTQYVWKNYDCVEMLSDNTKITQ